MTHRILLISGIAASLFYLAANIVGPMYWPGYSSVAISVSELSAIDALSRPYVLPWFVAYSITALLFGFGVRAAAGGNRPLRVSAFALIVIGVIDVLGHFFPMHLREVLAANGGTYTDTMHIILTSVTVFFILLAMGFGAAAFGTAFRYYSIATMVALAVGGTMAGLEAPGIDANLPTPWLGMWERINIGGYLLWQVVLAGILLRRAEK